MENRERPVRRCAKGPSLLLCCTTVCFLSCLSDGLVAAGRAAETPGAESAARATSKHVDLPSPALEYAFAVDRPARVSDGRYYAPFYSYVITPHAVADRGGVFCAFQNREGQPIVMVYSVNECRWSAPVKVSEHGLKGDDHGNPSLCIDREGYLHVFYGCHGGPMRHARSAKPWDIAAWEEQAPPTPRATYPQSILMADGVIWLLYRAGGHPEPWSLRTSSDNGQTWSEAERVIEMRLDPPDRLAAAYCYFFPGAGGRTIHCFWNHKDDNAARVSQQRPHPWRPLKYPGLHEAVYRYNVYYIKRDEQGTWRNAAGEPVKVPVSKAEADARCLVYDSGDEFTFLGMHLAVDAEDRPHIKFGTGVVDWARVEPRVIVPPRDKYASLVDGRWQLADQLPGDWPREVVRVVTARGEAAFGPEAAGWFIFCRREPVGEGLGATVFLYSDRMGYATHRGGPVHMP